jgi:crotonobetainyl-CoA:carnitine CoA-transferase CaiB-like acyl-CoA transferase
MDDINEWGAGGLGYVTRRPQDVDDRPYAPVLPPGRQPEVLAGISAATAALAGVRWARRAGRSILADVSRQEVQAAMLHGIVPPFVWNGIVVGSPASLSSRPGIGALLPATDGEIYLRTVELHQHTRLVEFMGSPAWAAEFADTATRLEHMAEFYSHVAEFTGQHPRQWLYEEGQRHGVAFSVPRTLKEVLEWEQLDARGMWRKVDLDGKQVLGPCLPLFEPNSWEPSEPATVAEVEQRWLRT